MSEDQSPEIEQPPEEPQYSDADEAVFYTLREAGIPLTVDMLVDRIDGHSEEEIREGMDRWSLSEVDYGGVTAYHLDRENTTKIEIDRDMYEEIRSKGFYIGEDPYGVNVHISEDYRSIGSVKHPDDTPDWDTWGPLFPIEADDEIDQTKPKTEHSSKTVMLEATADDIVQITSVHEGMRRIPEKMRVVKRTNTYHGPAIKLLPPEDWPGERTNYELTCPDRFSNLVLWKAITDHEGYIQTWLKIARVSAEIFNVAGYDFCEGCGEPIKDPMHRGLAMTGQCPGGMND